MPPVQKARKTVVRGTALSDIISIPQGVAMGSTRRNTLDLTGGNAMDLDTPLSSAKRSLSVSTKRTRNRPTRQHPTSHGLRSHMRNMHELAAVLVGSSEVKYVVHKAMLTSASPFFAAALDGHFTEAGDQTVRLPEEKPDIFEWFVQWLYTGSLANAANSCNDDCPADHAHQHHHSKKHSHPDTHEDGDLRNAPGMPKYFLLIEIYALSDRLLATAFSNHIVDTVARLSEATNSVPTPSDTWLLYGTNTSFTPPPSGGADMGIRASAPLRDLVLDLFVYKKTDKLLATHPDDWHPLFLRDLVVRVKRPGPDALARHALQPWLPRDWSQAQACNACMGVVGPDSVPASVRTGARQRGGRVADDAVKEVPKRCGRCERVYCAACIAGALEGGLEQGDPRFSLVGQDVGCCKPWVSWDGAILGVKRRGVCGRYHEHGPLGGRVWGNPDEEEE